MRTWACERRAAICATHDVASVTALTAPEQARFDVSSRSAA